MKDISRQILQKLNMVWNIASRSGTATLSMAASRAAPVRESKFDMPIAASVAASGLGSRGTIHFIIPRNR